MEVAAFLKPSVGGVLDVTPVSAVNPLPVTGALTIGSSGAYVDKSGTVTLGGTSQVLSAAGAKSYFFFQNTSDETLGINPMGGAATLASPSILVAPGGSWTPTVIPTAQISVIGATTGLPFSCFQV